MHRPIRSVLALVPLAWLAAGCVTIQTLGARRQPLVETVVLGETGPKVLLLDVDNVISEIDMEGPLGIGGVESTVARVREQLDKAKEDDAVKALLLRINSPGGGVTASDVVYHEILAFKQERKVPVVAQMMGMATSGGYYVAMASDWILAHPTTVTGSIGVISAGINLSGLMEQHGVTNQTLTGGAFKDAGSPLRPMTPAERAYLQAVVDEMHARFREVVKQGRPALSEPQVLALADGRVYTANQALEHGLVDAIGYLTDAVDELERRIDAPEVRVVSYHRQREWRSNIYSTAPAAPRSRADLAGALGLDRGPAFLYLWWPAGLAP